MFASEQRNVTLSWRDSSAPRTQSESITRDLLCPELDSGARIGHMVGRSPAARRLFAQIRAASGNIPVASFEGEPGTGKSLAARTLHDHSPASQAAFVPCMAEQFFESSADSLLNEAAHGTLLLTHVDELGAAQQARLYHLLEWLGHQRARCAANVPCQLLVTSRHNLRRMAMEERFRVDLCHRLMAVRFVLPPLREHREDIGLLAQYFASSFSANHDKAVRGLAPGTLPCLFNHPWPGNVRELESVIHAASLEVEGQWIRPIDVHLLTLAPLETAPALGVESEEEANLDRVIYRHIQRVLLRTSGNKLRAARLLGISRSTLYRMLEAQASSR